MQTTMRGRDDSDDYVTSPLFIQLRHIGQPPKHYLLSRSEITQNVAPIGENIISVETN